MRRRLILLLAVVLLLVLPLTAAPAAASPRADWWRAQALAAANLFATLDDGTEGGGPYADVAGGYAYLYGWSSTYATAALAKIWADRNPDGGWGLGYGYDAFNDGSVNPANTSYAVTTGEICQRLLSAYQAGATPRTNIQWCVDTLVHWPRVAVARGQCVSYSTTAADTAAGCVHNVSVAVAAFLAEVNAAGFGATGMQRLITDVILQETVAYRETALQWPYIGDGPFLDSDHDSVSAEAMYREGAYWIGREVAYKYMSNPAAAGGGPEAKAALVHTRLAGLPGGTGSWSRTEPGVTLWCQLSDQWHAEQAAYLTGITTARNAAQFFYLAARASKSC